MLENTYFIKLHWSRAEQCFHLFRHWGYISIKYYINYFDLILILGQIDKQMIKVLDQLFYKTFFKFNLKFLLYFMVKPCLMQISLKVRSWKCTDYLKSSVLILLQWYMYFGNISPISLTTSSQTNILYNIRNWSSQAALTDGTP